MTETQERAETKSPLREAICSVMAGIKRLEKADKNIFGKYDFTSVDDFKDQMRPLLATEGLEIGMNEVDCEIITLDDKKGTALARFQYEFTINHVSGESAPAEARTVIVQYIGAQTAGSAQSYALKEYFKSRFHASSGDTEAEADQRAQDEQMGDKLSKQESRGTWDKLKKEMNEVIDGKDHGALADWWGKNRSVLMTLPADWFNMLKNDYGEAWTRLEAEAKLDGMSEEQLDQIAQNGGVGQ